MNGTTGRAIAALEPQTARHAMAPPSRFGDKAFEWLTLAMALAVVVLVILLGWELWGRSSLAIRKFGFHFLTTSTWDPVAEQFGALSFIYGTLISSLIALLIAVPLSIATAAYLTELAPLWIRQPLVSLIEMLAAIPSGILGWMGIAPQSAASLFKPRSTCASVMANEFTEATTDMYLQALFEIGLVLFGTTILANLLAQLLLQTMGTTSTTRAVQ